MINWFNIPDEGLSNGGLFEVKELEVTENGTYQTKGEMYNKVTVNVEGGGGSSDFSTAEVTLINGSESAEIIVNVLSASLEDEDYVTAVTLDPTYGMKPVEDSQVTVTDNLTTTYVVDTSKGMVFVKYGENRNVYTVTGNAKVLDAGADKESQFYVKVTGDCTITIS